MDNDQIAEAWIKALRSGEYKQAFGSLRMQDEDGTYCHCVAGVLADIIDPNAWTGTGSEYISHDQDGEVNKLTDTAEYPQVYWHGSAFGIHYTEIGKYEIDYTSLNTAMRMNDDETADFNKIADYLEGALSNGSVG